MVYTLTLTCSKTFTWGHVSVFDKYLHWPHVNASVKKTKQNSNTSINVKSLNV
jgi:hypothetical protein